MDGKDIESVINSKEELELSSVVACNGTNHTEDESSPGSDESRAGGDGNKTSNDTRAETDGRPLAFQSVVHQTPGHTSNGGSQVSDNGSHNRTQVGRESRAGVESEPADPQEHGADDNVGDIVRAVVELVGSVATTLAQHQGVGERGRSGSNVHGGTTSEVKTSELEHPSRRVPCPAGDGVVDDSGPDEHEDNAGEHATTLSDCADSKSNTKKKPSIDVPSISMMDA